ncbi:uncharacterized protein LOC120455902 isoform X2 [Drosophila santomea]|uniref:uncharacterized protein LOC120455902 isoform X2 n=1 Tax=Drosophila santomea TaxID=129105 RepID=UPI00195385C9|nr:uncharacterized protein LOC120455902 isoform X2 [Drosophila santomea]
MLHSSYNRAPRRKLIPNLFSNILQVIADADHPLTEPEIMEAVADRLDRSDEELKRQITFQVAWTRTNIDTIMSPVPQSPPPRNIIGCRRGSRVELVLPWMTGRIGMKNLHPKALRR